MLVYPNDKIRFIFHERRCGQHSRITRTRAIAPGSLFFVAFTVKAPSMEPIEKDKPSLTLFLLMTVVYFAAYFGLKYGLFGGQLPVLLNLGLIAACLALAFFVRARAK